MADEDVIEQEEVDDSPPFSIIDGSTYYRRKKEWHLFADFTLKILGEITHGGLWVCAFGARVLGRHVERRIVIPASSFDGKVKFLEKTRQSFGGGTFNISEGALLESYYSFLKEEYYEGRPRQYYAAECIDLQTHTSDYWCLSKEVLYERSIGLLHSSIEERNVGKSLTLAKGHGVATRKNPTMLAGGNQNKCGASV
ncbi:uncharacterized protein [Montipora capricornis]|uniref:uncharacterized protein n=1 Tax=Montipora capricornis TaxID=246305 RepID=UPI0035F1B369